MKRQLERLKGKRLVTGDINLMKKDEICINETPNGVEVKEIGKDGKIKDLAGSDSGGGIKEYYYEFVYNPDIVVDELLILFIIKEIVCDYNDGVSYKVNKLTGSYGGFVTLEEQINEYCKYIITLDCPVSVSVNGEIVTSPKGSVAEKFEDFINMMNPNASAEEIEAVINAVNASFIPITKEEYEAVLKDLGIQ